MAKSWIKKHKTDIYIDVSIGSVAITFYPFCKWRLVFDWKYNHPMDSLDWKTIQIGPITILKYRYGNG